ncbi:hypothetical protein WA1_18880 [Scytonema hofmannii PCC 7110]|uniref:Uncharacterized protein n=1 Tax=Scytonema hofmannii PCC 7110 TaxID=128403 RepID=A0A139XBI1_9CYAN|nr:hypothetical protein [Scytonema hofmannii]KYC42068.1 hypothetical protein WA1_18880 [Scytonema hofmannii PCC 7110]
MLDQESLSLIDKWFSQNALFSEDQARRCQQIRLAAKEVAIAMADPDIGGREYVVRCQELAEIIINSCSESIERHYALAALYMVMGAPSLECKPFNPDHMAIWLRSQVIGLAEQAIICEVSNG